MNSSLSGQKPHRPTSGPRSWTRVMPAVVDAVQPDQPVRAGEPKSYSAVHGREEPRQGGGPYFSLFLIFGWTGWTAWTGADKIDSSRVQPLCLYPDGPDPRHHGDRPRPSPTLLSKSSSVQPSSNARLLDIAFRQLGQNVLRHTVSGRTAVRAVFGRGITVTRL
jgi:hypothetical protein